MKSFMKNRLFISILLAFLVAGTANASDFKIKEGVNYVQVKEPARLYSGYGNVEVVGIFWYRCPHCFHLRDAIEQWQSSPITSKKIRYIERPAAVDRWLPEAEAFYAIHDLKLDSLDKALFNALHVEHKKIRGADALAQFIADHSDVSKSDVLAKMKSKSVEARIHRDKKLQEGWGVTGVPTFIVDGKYRVINNSVRDKKDIFEIINQLATKVSQERK